ncbi:hypothetical protein [Desulfovibrio sp.]|uniref:hypothetical protein n=1 Tax=Desulfovibrio sp. TaxID=885 RepID=UPI0025BC3879|nr:hypothetical protein [Desulfovibrio sp.]
MGLIDSILGLGGKVMDKVWPDRAASREQQSQINQTEVSGAPASFLRLWRSFLGWMLSLLFCWEVIGRSIIMTYWPDTKLPPSTLEIVSRLLLGMLGLGF